MREVLVGIVRMFHAICRARMRIVARRNALPRPALDGPPNKTVSPACRACSSGFASGRALRVCSLPICLCVDKREGGRERGIPGPSWLQLCCTVSMVVDKLSVRAVCSTSVTVMCCAASGMAEDDHGRRYSTRKKMAPLRWYINEKKEYERKHESAYPYTGVTCWLCAPTCVAVHFESHSQSCGLRVID